MPRLIIVTILILSAQFVLGQKNNLPTKKEAKTDSRNQNCVKRVNNTFTTRLKNYPFSHAAQIQLVSFKGGVDTTEDQIMKMNDSLPRLNDTVCYSQLIEVKTITYSQVDKLTDILYNYGYGAPVSIGSSSMCYFPRNAILFLDANGKVFEFIEICFECSETRTSSDKISLGDRCNQKMGMLKNFFKASQIEYGITKGRRFDN